MLVVFGATDGIELEPWGRTLAQRYGLDLELREKFWADACSQAGIHFVPLLHEFRKRRKASATPPHGFAPMLGRGHWNQIGHRWAAEILADALEPLLSSCDPRQNHATVHVTASVQSTDTSPKQPQQSRASGRSIPGRPAVASMSSS